MQSSVTSPVELRVAQLVKHILVLDAEIYDGVDRTEYVSKLNIIPILIAACDFTLL